MTRNKELYLPIALSMALTLVSGLLCGFLGGPWAALTGSGSVLLTTLLWMSTTWSRYKKLQNTWLRYMQAGNFWIFVTIGKEN